VCGFSDGGAVATILALRHPGMVSAVVNHGGYDLFNPEAPSIAITRQILGGRPDATEPDFESVAHVAAQSPEFADLIGRMEADHDQAQGRGHWRTVIAQTYPRITTPHDYVLGDLAGLESPALVLVGDRDQFCTVEEGATASRAFPMGELAVLPGTGHLITDEAVRVAIDFLAR
jgi:pimeloyl-ACP methyl ester carboxylesterase